MSVPTKVPPGFRFHPTDEELVDYYLKKKVESQRIDLDVIREIDLYKIEPWDLQERCRIGSTDQDEWYFFSHKDKKYPTGTRTNRATTAGFWKATGRDKAIYNKHKLVGMRKTLVFYRGRAPNGQKTDWIMHEYRLENCDNGCNPLQTSEEGWAVCRVFKKRSPNIKALLGHDRDSMMMGGGSSSNCGFVEDPMSDFFNTDGLVLDSPKHTMNHHHHHNVHNNHNNALNGHPAMGGLMQLMGTGHLEPGVGDNTNLSGHFHSQMAGGGVGGYPHERQLMQQLAGMHQPHAQQLYGLGISGAVPGQLSLFSCKQELEQLADFHLSHELSPFMQLPQLMESPKISAVTSGPGGAPSCSSSFNYGSGPPLTSSNVGQHVRALIQLGAGHNMSGSTPDNPNVFNTGHNSNNVASAASILASLSAGSKLMNHADFDACAAASVTDWRILDRLVASQLSQDQHQQRHNIDPNIDNNPNSSCVTKDQSLQLTPSPEAFHGHGSDHTGDAVDLHDQENSIASDEPNVSDHMKQHSSVDTIATSENDPNNNNNVAGAGASTSSPSTTTYNPNNDIDLWSFASKRS